MRCSYHGQVTVSSDNASKFQKPASPLKSAVGENLKSLISGKVPLPSPVQGNLPRLFAIREDGSGTELLRDDQLLAYFKDAVKDPETEVIEERLQEGGALSIIVVKPLHVSKSRNLVYRQLNRYPPLDTSRRLQVKAEVQKYREWFEAEAKDSERYTVAELNRDALPVDTTHQSSQTQTLLLGANKRITEEFILKKYQIKEAHNQSEKIVSFAKKDQNDHRAHWMKPRLLKGTQKSAKALSGAPPPVSAVVKPAQQKIVSASEIPGYFKSVEAAQFLPEINWVCELVDVAFILSHRCARTP